MTDLPAPGPPAGKYLPAVVHDGVAYSAGAVPFVDGVLAMAGRVGDDLDVDAGRECARIAARNALSAVADAAGGVENVERLLRVGVFVQCAPDFQQTPRVADGATEALMEILGDGGRCARTAVGVYSLPLGAPVEVELVAALRRR